MDGDLGGLATELREGQKVKLIGDVCQGPSAVGPQQDLCGRLRFARGIGGFTGHGDRVRRSVPSNRIDTRPWGVVT